MLSSAKKRYLLAIYELGKSGNEVFSKDIAISLKIKRSSVSRMLKSIAEDSLICKEYYGRVQFSEQGTRFANQLYTKYLLLYSYFCKYLRVPEEEARHDAILCLCELSDNSIQKIAFIVLDKQEKQSNGLNMTAELEL